MNIVHIRSKDVAEDDVLNTFFTVNLKSKITASIEQEIHVSLISCEIPHSFYCISSDLQNNTIVYNTNMTLLLPNQNYDISELLRVINADGEFPFTASHNIYTNKLTLVNNTSENQTINWGSSLSTKLLGFENGNITVSAGQSITSDNIVDLATVHSIFVRCDLSNGNVQSTNTGNTTILQKISVDCNPFNIIYFNDQDHVTTSVIDKRVIDHISFRITDQNDNLLNFNRVNYEFAISFQVKSKEVLKHERILPPVGIINVSKPEQNSTIDDTHPIEGKSEIEHDSEQIVLDALIEQLND